MATVTAFQAKTRFGELLNRVVRGEEIVITRHEKAVARLVPEGRCNLESVRAAVADLRQLRQRIADRTEGKPKLTLDEVKSAIAEGRR
jgi:prevent-host-death family protein